MSNYQDISDAIRDRAVLSISYSGSIRIIEPHLIGVTMADNVALSAYQVEAPSGVGFRIFVVNDIAAIERTGENFEEPRPGFNPNDQTMKEVLTSI